jgi:hypothetical protein
MRNAIMKRILMMTERDLMVMARIAECMVPGMVETPEELKNECIAPEIPSPIETRRMRTITPEQAAGSMAHCKTSTETHFQNRREEIELEEEKFRRHFGGNE